MTGRAATTRLAPLHRRGAFFGTRCSECVKQSDIG